MNPVKNKSMSLTVALIIVAIFNLVVFVIPFNRGGGFWSGYTFSMLAIVLTVLVSAYAFKHEGIKSKIYGLPLISLVWRYLIIQLILGLMQMFLDFIPVPFQYGLVVNAILLGLCLIWLIAVETGKDEIIRIDEKVKEKTFYIKSLQIDVEGLAERTSDEPSKKARKDLAETIRYSDPMSNPQLATIENKIEIGIANLCKTTDSTGIMNYCNELQQLLAERNRKCKVFKEF